MSESKFDVTAALSKKKAELEGQIEKAAQETAPAEKTNSAGIAGNWGSETPATEEEKRRFAAVSGPDLVDLPEEERRELQLSGLWVLKDQLHLESKDDEGLRETARTAEKMLFLSRVPQVRDWASRIFVRAHIHYAIQHGENIRDPMACELSDIPDTIAALQRRKEALPERGDPKKKKVNLIVCLVMLAAMAAVWFIPAISALFTEENVSNALMAIGVIAVIAAFFIGGFGGSAVVLVLYALLVAGLQAILPMALLGKVLVLLLLGSIGFFAFRKYAGEAKKLKPAQVRRRADELTALNVEVERCISYINGLEEQVDACLQKYTSERESSAGGEAAFKAASMKNNLEKYKERLRKQRGTLRLLVPSR